VIVSSIVADDVRLPDVPVTSTITGPPTVAAVAAVNVSTCVPAAEPAAKLAVTPLGRPDAASATEPENPFIADTAIVLVPTPF
jgi:hypothetical protein